MVTPIHRRTVAEEQTKKIGRNWIRRRSRKKIKAERQRRKATAILGQRKRKTERGAVVARVDRLRTVEQLVQVVMVVNI